MTSKVVELSLPIRSLDFSAQAGSGRQGLELAGQAAALDGFAPYCEEIVAAL